MIYAAVAPVLDRHLAHLTAVIGIPLAGLGVLLLALVDLRIVRGKRAHPLLVVSALIVMAVALGFMVYRFAKLQA